MSIEDRAMERLLESMREDPAPRPRTDREHRRLFGYAWDNPNTHDRDDDLAILWGPPEVV